MSRFATRRLRNGLAGLLAMALLWTVVELRGLTMQDSGRLTGWLLVAALVVLGAYNLRKKLPVLPLGDSASWLQLHLYLGLVTALLFFLHGGWGLPDGPLEILLWGLVLGLLVTGIFGLALSRLAPAALTWHGERVIHERIPQLRRRLADEVEELVTRAVEETSSGTLAGYHVNVLKRYFARPRHRWYHLVRSKRPLRHLCREIEALKRYLGPGDRAVLDEIEARIVAKDNLDFQETWQGLLKGWLFLHVPLTYATLVMVPLHVVLAYAFGAGRP
ncbi:hypothetical protein SAMN06265365_13045 [Tistlia consotensis]|uniref:Uncharacterized protein n=1 Tax=Tistlia consotensis USBA 355 TaxID=560819 RepID=A0A1Y6CLX5_9PROT|nr:hypothetical protein [Tistlia consotensis]SMF72604.1 hypothetical protein SAMN05428998_13145 [Tistlia consotensis USBA 355]SNS09515.1 hypothetical protein SAMN06265365_13045 [Tistlia consotensis]